MKFSEMLRAPHIKRWGIVDVRREQSIAEHSFMVALLAEEFYSHLIGEENNIEPGVVRELYELAIWHDMAECITGDINSAYKDLINVNEEQICPRLQCAREAQTHEWQEVIIKIVDKLEAIRYLNLYGVQCGNLDDVNSFIFGKLAKLITEAEKAWPQFNWDVTVKTVHSELY